jgi:hypothetical protein
MGEEGEMGGRESSIPRDAKLQCEGGGENCGCEDGGDGCVEVVATELQK